MSSYRRKRSLNFQTDDAIQAIGRKIEDIGNTTQPATTTSDDKDTSKEIEKLKESLFIDLVVQAHKQGQY